MTVTCFVDIGTKMKLKYLLKIHLKDRQCESIFLFKYKDQQLNKIQEHNGDPWNLFEGDVSHIIQRSNYVLQKHIDTKKVILRNKQLKFPVILKPITVG